MAYLLKNLPLSSCNKRVIPIVNIHSRPSVNLEEQDRGHTKNIKLNYGLYALKEIDWSHDDSWNQPFTFRTKYQRFTSPPVHRLGDESSNEFTWKLFWSRWCNKYYSVHFSADFFSVIKLLQKVHYISEKINLASIRKYKCYFWYQSHFKNHMYIGLYVNKHVYVCLCVCLCVFVCLRGRHTMNIFP